MFNKSYLHMQRFGPKHVELLWYLGSAMHEKGDLLYLRPVPTLYLCYAELGKETNLDILTLY